MKKFLFGIFASLIFSINSFAQDFTATVNRNPVPEGETVVLTLELNNIDTSTNPDLSELSKDFTIMSVSNGYRTNIFNNDVSKSRQWNLVMIPNRSGTINIPSITLDKYQTKPISLKVTPAGSQPELSSASQHTSKPNYKITGNIDNNNPYVQQQITYQLKIYDAGGLHGEAPIFLTSNEDWIIKSLGEPTISSQIINGRNIREIIFNYALFPQKSGHLEVPAVRFNGYYLTQNRRTDPFARFFADDDFFSDFSLTDVFARRNPIILTTKPIAVDVKPAAITDGWWLPASKVELSAEFDSSKPKFVAGEPTGRTIYLKVYGVMDNQLPELKFPNISNVKQYPEKPLTESFIENGQIVSQAKINNVYIPSIAGEITLPEIKLNWFDIKNNKTATAFIPEYKTYAQSNTSISQTQPITEPEAITSVPSENTAIKSEQISNTFIIWLLLGSFVGGILITLLLIKLFTLITNRQPDHYSQVIKASQKSDIHLLRDELLLWGQNKFPTYNITNLQDIAAIYNDTDFNVQMDKIRAFLYSGQNAQWNSKEFINVFRKISSRKSRKNNSDNEMLPKLYK